jgi:hypothetical protein
MTSFVPIRKIRRALAPLSLLGVLCACSSSSGGATGAAADGGSVDGSATAGPFCKGPGAGHTYCFDFEDGRSLTDLGFKMLTATLVFKYDSPALSTTQARDTTSLHAPLHLRGSTTGANLVYTEGTASFTTYSATTTAAISSFHLHFEYFLEAIGSSATVNPWGSTCILSSSIDDYTCDFNVAPAGSGFQWIPGKEPAALGQWGKADLAISVIGTKATVTRQIDDNPPVTRMDTLASFNDPSTFDLGAIPEYATLPPGALAYDSSVYIDNIVIDVNAP